MEQTNQAGESPRKTGIGAKETRESRRNLNRPVKFISNRLILFRRSNFPSPSLFRRLTINGRIVRRFLVPATATPIFHSPLTFLFSTKTSSPLSRRRVTNALSLSLSFSPSLRPRLYCLDASSMREFSPFLLASSRPSPFLPPFHVSPGYARRRAPLSAPLREDINRGILNRFEDRNIPPPLVRNVEIFFRLLLSPVFFFVADTIRATSSSTSRARRRLSNRRANRPYDYAYNCSGSSFLTRRMKTRNTFSKNDTCVITIWYRQD